MHLVIIGGTAAGMSCAARARRLDENADITVVEKTAHVSSASCGLPYHLSGTIPTRAALEVETPDSLRASLNIDVRLGHEAIGIDPDFATVRVRTAGTESDVPYDAVVIATGTRSATPQIPGLDHDGVSTLRTIEDAVSIKTMLDEFPDGHRARVAVVGAGFIGVEAAENLLDAGASVSVIDGGDHPLGFVDADIASYATQSLLALGADMRMGTTVKAIENPAAAGDHPTAPLRVVFSDGAVLDVDLVLVATGVRPNSEPFTTTGIRNERGWITVDEHGATSIPGIWAAGDVTMRVDRVTGERHPAALAGPSNREGRLVADAILDPDHARPLPPTLGTAIIRIGHSVIGATGANSTALKRAGIPFQTIHLQPSQHAGYFPGACALDMRLHIGVDGRILGAQIAGDRPAGDHRLDDGA
ncbi:FAD-dependent oxidoreductase [uncultured Bifidobacterium sp.]|uniref:NAD(P)/FAD-dependent oxidoreductase n=1 Tax=uncultured Bifidobacterium sp. TaxID=165187 RepID=UPI00261DEE49|nr:FAD-dependent oxidoreductase [uncultured Bifidobacterium sp.]